MLPNTWARRGSIDSSDDSSRHSSLPASLQAHLFHGPANGNSPLIPNQSHTRTGTTPSYGSESEGSHEGGRQQPRHGAVATPHLALAEDSIRHRPARPWEEVRDNQIHRISLEPVTKMPSHMHKYDERTHLHGHSPLHLASQTYPPLRSMHERNVSHYSPYPQPPPALLPHIAHHPANKEKRPLPPLMTSTPTRLPLLPPASAKSRPSALTPLISVGPHPQTLKVASMTDSVNHLSPERQPLACIFCRSRKIACKRPDKSAVDQTCKYVV